MLKHPGESTQARTLIALREHPFFSHAALGAESGLAEAAQTVTFPAGALIFEEHAPPDALYLVLGGKVVFTKAIRGNPRRTISVCCEGEFFGEVGVLMNEPRSLSALADGPCTLAVIPGEAVREVLRDVPAPVVALVHSLVRHLHQTTRHYIEDILQQEKLAVVGAMVNSIVHDFKNPFTLISLGAHLLLKQHDDPQTTKICRNIETQVKRMVFMANEVVDFCRGTSVIHREPVNLAELALNFRELNEPIFESSRVRIDIDAEPFVIEAEENKLLRVLQNLVGNAIDSIPAERSGHIRVLLTGRGDEAVLEVSDNGVGIPEEIRDSLFEPFVTMGKTRGTGLGTAIAKSLVEAHGGRIEFQSEVGLGTTFTVRVPREVPVSVQQPSKPTRPAIPTS
ncbi:MAG: ATP-binding protein [Opitutales bacterium]